jgi:hypothetical protein
MPGPDQIRDEAPGSGNAPAMNDPAIDESRGEDSIAARAYRRFEERGGEHGHDVEDWLEAEREFQSRKTE